MEADSFDKKEGKEAARFKKKITLFSGERICSERRY